MSATSATGPWASIAGPSDPDELHEQLTASESLNDGTAHLHEQLAEDFARPTKPGDSDPHANDPSQTTTIQRKYAQRLRGRFDSIKAEINRGVRDRDFFNLDDREESETVDLQTLVDQLAPNGRERFYELLAAEEYEEARRYSESLVEQLAEFSPDDLDPRDYTFERDADRHEEFMDWLRGQQEDGVLEVIQRDDNVFVRSAYERGIKNADSWSDFSPDVDVAQSIQMPVHEDRLRLLYERNFEALRGITNDVSREISRELANGLAEGVGPDEMARRLNDRVESIGKTRATTLARTETMNAHNEAALNRYEEIFDDPDVEVMSEVSTAGDAHVCEICEPWDGQQLSAQEARSDGPPFHPRCRCVLLPVANGEDSAATASATTGAAS